MKRHVKLTIMVAMGLAFALAPAASQEASKRVKSWGEEYQEEQMRKDPCYAPPAGMTYLDCAREHHLEPYQTEDRAFEQKLRAVNQRLDLARCKYISLSGTSAQLQECLSIYQRRYGDGPSPAQVLQEMRKGK